MRGRSLKSACMYEVSIISMVQGWGQIICTCDQGRGGQLSASMYIAPAHTGDLGIRFQGAKLSLHCQGLANTKWLPCWICKCDNSHKCDQGGGLLSATMYIILAHTGDLESGSRRVQSWDYIARDLQIRSGYHVYLWMWYFTYGQGIIYTNMKNLWKIYCTHDSVMQKNHDVLFLKFLHNIEKNKCSIKKSTSTWDRGIVAGSCCCSPFMLHTARSWKRKV